MITKLNPLIHLNHCQNCSDIRLRSWDVHDDGKAWDETIHLAPEEMTPLTGSEWKRCIWDLSRIIIAEPHQLTIFAPGARGVPSRDAQFDCKSWIIHMDVNKFFKVVLMLREKKINTDLDLNSFRKPDHAKPTLNLTQIAKHENAIEIAPTVSAWMKAFDAEHRKRLHDWLNNYITRTTIAGSYGKDELYFSGQRKDGTRGLGFNGAAILHGTEFSVHT